MEDIAARAHILLVTAAQQQVFSLIPVSSHVYCKPARLLLSTHYIILILACHPSPLFPPIVTLYKSPLLTFCTTDEDPRIETSCFNGLFAVICSSNYLLINDYCFFDISTLVKRWCSDMCWRIYCGSASNNGFTFRILCERS